MNKVKLARQAIKTFLETGKRIESDSKQPGACFVTLYKHGQLRGCIGNIEPVGSLEQGIIDNAISAATRDGRFEPVQESELEDLEIEVSVLSPLKPYQPKNSQVLLDFLAKNKPGLVIQKFGQRAVFLPQVWEELGEPEEFLRQLCLKAGLAADDWQEAAEPPFRFELKTFTLQKCCSTS